MPEINHKPPSAKVKRAIGALFSGEAKNQREAAEIAGMWAPHLSKALSRPTVREYIASTIHHRLTSTGAMLASRVVEALVETAESEYVRADLAKWLLALNGVKPASDRVSRPSEAISLTINLGAERIEVGKSQPIDITPQPTEVVASVPAVIEQDQ